MKMKYTIIYVIVYNKVYIYVMFDNKLQ